MKIHVDLGCRHHFNHDCVYTYATATYTLMFFITTLGEINNYSNVLS